jgi:hypothetical protein
MFLLDDPASFKTIHPGHRNVQYDDIRMQPVNLLNGFHAIRCFAHNFPIAATLQQSPQALSNDWMIIHQQDSNRHAVPHYRILHPVNLTAATQPVISICIW